MLNARKIELHALHGFLGLPSDWDFLSPTSLKVDVVSSYDIFGGTPAHAFDGGWSWAQHFNTTIRNAHCSEKVAPLRILLGYSMGGRLAMHALLQSTELWDAAILISAHPGLTTESERIARYASDCSWAHCFLSDEWNLLLHKWNARQVFSNTHHSYKREEHDFSRNVLSDALRGWSLGKQESLKERVDALQLPILWIAGQEDMHYASIASKMTFSHFLSKVWIVPQAGHRMPWEQKQAFLLQIQSFIQSISSRIIYSINLIT